MKDGSRIIHFIDTETTGLDHRRHEVISVGILEVKEVRTGERLGRYSSGQMQMILK